MPLAPLFRMIQTRLKTAHSIADAADACVTSGNDEGAFRVLFDIEQPLHEATTLLNAACLMRREYSD
jgi:hypothetical protein